ncbi:MAG: metallopeptidase family protein [Candidatus Paceibacterota bacterium]|jgi:predicted Zn-dependent protease with MMP-like domain
MEAEKFEELVNEGIKAIPEEFLEKLDNVAIVIEDEPTPDQIKQLKLGRGSSLFGLYEGIPLNKRSNYAQVVPDKITIFKKIIEDYARSEQAIKEMVANTVWHEIAHHFGLDEKEVGAADRRRRNGKK